MKIFQIQLGVEITEVGELQDPKPSFAEEIERDIRDDPVKAQAKLVDKLTSIAVPSPAMAVFPARPTGLTMSDSVKITAGSFEELQTILRKFHDLAQSLTIEGL